MVGPDGKEYWTTKQAAEALDVAPSTISTWRRNGYLTPVPKSPPRKPLYRQCDVIHAEKIAYDNAIRTSGSAKRTSRRHFMPLTQHREPDTSAAA
ncbi:hypothetical protein BJF79_03785 [Actinomadura sp. CNU-125]|uniref:helix-turn-helix domain-containing protein n=1 Tax=Actinomadura sp. CNU-125 TaxID=1904961 RepID=UPI00095ECB58|nr:helix-turn-helix domain-containing protein [Actinomadura sp. CNU-125]OLT13030.1 hypothetical protein BJF79_03785 [Actinomadura sp. CNU-125]